MCYEVLMCNLKSRTTAYSLVCMLFPGSKANAAYFITHLNTTQEGSLKILCLLLFGATQINKSCICVEIFKITRTCNW